MYPAGTYSYETKAADAGGVTGGRVTTAPVEVSYAAGLGYSAPATTGVTGDATLQQADDTNYLTLGSNSNLNDNTTIQVLPSTGAANTETITISGTRPMSVWYTVGTSQPENPANNIYIPTENKLVGGNGNTATAGGSN